jgi:hypothetical protein
MACSRCGAPLEFADGQPRPCHFCGQVDVAPAPAPAADDGPRGPTRVYVSGGQTYGSVEEMPDSARSNFRDSATYANSTARPPPDVPTGGRSLVGMIALLAAIAVGGAVVFSIVSSTGSEERHHPAHQHHRGR